MTLRGILEQRPKRLWILIAWERSKIPSRFNEKSASSSNLIFSDPKISVELLSKELGKLFRICQWWRWIFTETPTVNSADFDWNSVSNFEMLVYLYASSWLPKVLWCDWFLLKCVIKCQSLPTLRLTHPSLSTWCLKFPLGRRSPSLTPLSLTSSILFLSSFPSVILASDGSKY